MEGTIGAEGGSLGFVDDFTAWRTGADCVETTRKLRLQVLQPAARWARESGATFEANKTGLIHFKYRPSDEDRRPSLRFLGTEIEPQDKIKVLGVILDAKLRMAAHIEKIIERATKKCLAIGRLRGVRPKQVRQLYRTVINATTDYAASSWYARGRRGVQDHLARLGRVQRMGAQAVIGAFRTVSSAVLQDEAGLEPAESRLARRAAKHALDVRALPRDHPLSMIMTGMERRSDRHPTPLFETWSRYHKVIQGTKGLGVMPKLPHALPPWHDRQDLVIIQDEAEALLFHQRISMVKSKQLLYYTDASVRNGWAGIAVVRYQPHGTTTVPKVVRQETIGREKACTVASAEIYAIRTALEFLRKDRATGWIVTDSQEALRRIDSGGRSRKSEAVVQAALREIQVIRETGHKVKLIWIPGHCGIAGNERAHSAAQKMTVPGIRTMVEPERRVREYSEVFKLLRKEVEADIPRVFDTWGRYTHAIDSALPGKHTLQLYNMLSHEDAGILAQARTGHTHLNEYLARIKRVESAACACQGGAESVKHVILQCQMWTAQRQPLKEAAGERWGDVSFLLGGKSRRRDARTGKLIDGDQWQPNLDAVRATITFLKSTGRFSSQAYNTNSSQQDSHGVATPVTLA